MRNGSRASVWRSMQGFMQLPGLYKKQLQALDVGPSGSEESVVDVRRKKETVRRIGRRRGRRRQVNNY